MKFIVRGLIRALSKISNWAADSERPAEGSIYELKDTELTEKQILDLWDYLKFVDNSQAFHLKGVVGFEEWVDMEEIRRRIVELFRVDYKNDRSLYPYIKTLVDSGLFETTNAGGRRKWRRKELIIENEVKSPIAEALDARKKQMIAKKIDVKGVA